MSKSGCISCSDCAFPQGWYFHALRTTQSMRMPKKDWLQESRGWWPDEARWSERCRTCRQKRSQRNLCSLTKPLCRPRLVPQRSLAGPLCQCQLLILNLPRLCFLAWMFLRRGMGSWGFDEDHRDLNWIQLELGSLETAACPSYKGWSPSGQPDQGSESHRPKAFRRTGQELLFPSPLWRSWRPES